MILSLLERGRSTRGFYDGGEKRHGFTPAKQKPLSERE